MGGGVGSAQATDLVLCGYTLYDVTLEILQSKDGYEFGDCQ